VKKGGGGAAHQFCHQEEEKMMLQQGQHIRQQRMWMASADCRRRGVLVFRFSGLQKQDP